MTLDDDIIRTYRAHPKADKEAQTEAFKSLSKAFHDTFRRSVTWGKHRGLIVETPQTTNFWRDLIDSAPNP